MPYQIQLPGMVNRDARGWPASESSRSSPVYAAKEYKYVGKPLTYKPVRVQQIRGDHRVTARKSTRLSPENESLEFPQKY